MREYAVAPVEVEWDSAQRHFVVRSHAMQTWGPKIQKIPGARMSFRDRGFLVPEIAVVDLARVLGAAIEPQYLDYLRRQAKDPDPALIPPVSPGGRVLRHYQRIDAMRMYNRSWACFNAAGTGKTTVYAAAWWSMHRDGLTQGMVWTAPLQTHDQIVQELKTHWHIEAAAAEDWRGEAVMLINPEKCNPKWGYTPEVEQILHQRNGVLLVDELHLAGNANQFSDQILRWRWLAKWRWGGSGTPVQNRLKSVYRPYKFISGSTLSESDWCKKYLTESGEPKPGAVDQIGCLAATWSSSRRKTDPEVAKDLPPMEIVIRKVKMTGRQKELYESCRKAFVAEIQAADEKSMALWLANPFTRMMRLLQVARDPRMLGEDMADEAVAKVRGLADVMAELEGENVVVWSGHPAVLDRVQETYGGVTYHGKDSMGARRAARQAFMAGEASVFAANYSVAGTGLDGLQNAAAFAVVLDLPAQAPHWRQLLDRLHRIGQARPVTVYLLLAEGTVEEQQWKRLQMKEKESSVLMGEASYGTFTKTDLLEALQ